VLEPALGVEDDDDREGSAVLDPQGPRRGHLGSDHEGIARSGAFE
jgi:hypothetical protein